MIGRRAFGLMLGSGIAAPAFAQTRPAVQTWQVGQVKISRIEESANPPGMRPGTFIPEATPETLAALPWLRPDLADSEGRVPFSNNGYVIDTGERRILVDAGTGDGKTRQGRAPTQSPRFMPNLLAAGYAPEVIDTVTCTHMHVDHIGWFTTRTEAGWRPTFRRAQYKVSRDDFTHFSTQAENVNERIAFVESIQPVVLAGKLDRVASDYRIAPEVTLVPTPGHTPGHVSVRVYSEGQEALITGDFVHFPLEFAHPDWRYPSDFNVEQAVATRQKTYAELAQRRVLVIGTHFPYPTAGRLVREGAGYRFEVQP